MGYDLNPGSGNHDIHPKHFVRTYKGDERSWSLREDMLLTNTQYDEDHFPLGIKN